MPSAIETWDQLACRLQGGMSNNVIIYGNMGAVSLLIVRR